MLREMPRSSSLPSSPSKSSPIKSIQSQIEQRKHPTPRCRKKHASFHADMFVAALQRLLISSSVVVVVALPVLMVACRLCDNSNSTALLSLSFDTEIPPIFFASLSNDDKPPMMEDECPNGNNPLDNSGPITPPSLVLLRLPVAPAPVPARAPPSRLELSAPPPCITLRSADNGRNNPATKYKYSISSGNIKVQSIRMIAGTG
mmetsp:Transcript_6283/g.14195  ORF Transcript_6283/g.14195 Transcript_6283/m.14195 type:complete len:203 (+) Transcript_6283:1430-2038(+)